MPFVNVDGHQLYYESVGTGPHPVLLLPGFLGVIKTDFAKIFPTLNKTKYRWICWDPPGYGQSYPPRREHDLGLYPRMATLAANMMEKLGYPRFSVLGWSQGGSFAVILAAKFPEKMISLVLWGVFALCTIKLQKFHEVCAKLELWETDRLAEKLEHFDQDYLRYECKGMVELVKRCMKSHEGRYFGPTIPEVLCPCLIIHGKKDHIVDEAQPTLLQEAFKDAKVVIYPEAGHDLHLVHTAQFVKEVEDFLEVQKY